MKVKVFSRCKDTGRLIPFRDGKAIELKEVESAIGLTFLHANVDKFEVYPMME